MIIYDFKKPPPVLLDLWSLPLVAGRVTAVHRGQARATGCINAMGERWEGVRGDGRVALDQDLVH